MFLSPICIVAQTWMDRVSASLLEIVPNLQPFFVLSHYLVHGERGENVCVHIMCCPAGKKKAWEQYSLILFLSESLIVW